MFGKAAEHNPAAQLHHVSFITAPSNRPYYDSFCRPDLSTVSVSLRFVSGKPAANTGPVALTRLAEVAGHYISNGDALDSIQVRYYEGRDFMYAGSVRTRHPNGIPGGPALSAGALEIGLRATSVDRSELLPRTSVRWHSQKGASQ